MKQIIWRDFLTPTPKLLAHQYTCFCFHTNSWSWSLNSCCTQVLVSATVCDPCEGVSTCGVR